MSNNKKYDGTTSFSQFMCENPGSVKEAVDEFYADYKEESKGTGILEQMRKNPVKYNASITLDRFRKFVKSLH